ncbi:MAG: iron-containing alcohol dehydrogenase [Clostridiales Family XIII bacterium]|jgi:alcohol dehydrogenase YqhD (iron-dependent ADH family)|nr:iron-containing alcohol dehydrogenase [Clostridiales Family XIII bacterium]
MLDFEFYAPTRILFGREAMDRLPQMLETCGATKVLLAHYGAASPKAPVADAIAVLEKASIPYIEFTGIQPNPLLSRALEGIELCKKEQVDFILSVGGASVIDTCKAIAAGVKLREDEDIWEDYYFPKIRFGGEALSIGVVLTIPAAGSEASFGSCITEDSTMQKRYTGGECLLPKFAVLNPVYTTTLPPYQTACGAIDILAHLLERYFVNFPNVDLSDRMIEACARTILINAPGVLRNPDDCAARGEIMWAGSIAHNKILEMGRTHGDWASHDIGHELSGAYDMAHGASLAVILPSYIRYVYKYNIPRFMQCANRIFDVDIAYDRPDDVIEEMIRRLERFCEDLGVPTKLKGYDIDDARFEEMAAKALDGRKHVGTGWGIHLLGKADVIEVFKLSLQ